RVPVLRAITRYSCRIPCFRAQKQVWRHDVPQGSAREGLEVRRQKAQGGQAPPAETPPTSRIVVATHIAGGCPAQPGDAECAQMRVIRAEFAVFAHKSRFGALSFPKVLRGKAWKFGVNIDTDQIIPAKYAIYSLDEKELGKHAMEGVPGREGWASQVTPGDILVADSNFGCGSSRESAPVAIRGAGI